MIFNPQFVSAPKVIVALDFDNLTRLRELLAVLSPLDCGLKVGHQLFINFGPQIIHSLVASGFRVFLDLKFHDIPHTVYQAVKAATQHNVWMINIHALGGAKMMQAAKQAILDSIHQPLLIGVTILTSHDLASINELGLKLDINHHVLNLAQLCYKNNLDGVVCSSLESQLIKKHTATSFLTIAPGIRLSNNTIDDQTRIATPEFAIQNQVDYLVIGRPITNANNPKQILEQINYNIRKTINA